MGLVTWIFNSDNRRHIRRLNKIANKVEALESKFEKLKDEELVQYTQKLKDRYKEGEALDDLLPEAFALVREASFRVLGMKHYHVQIMGGIALHQGRIAEMCTGEGKTLVATLPSFLNALSGNGVHIVTVNEYLATRDSEWMGKIHRFLGLTVGVIKYGMTAQEKRDAYNCDITYGTNNEIGFDYLRDNMVLYKQDRMQRKLNYAIIDEVDSILIDEARTPLIISGESDKPSDVYISADRFAKTLNKEEDLDIDEKKKAISLKESGVEKAEKYFHIENLSDLENTELNHYINNALRANYIMSLDDDYIVKDGEILIVDEYTGRIMIGRRFSEGLHQALEAKEGVKIQKENKTLATITFQNLFRLYDKLSGMTGTAKTEETEFKEIYKLDVVVIPPNKSSERIDEKDEVYKTKNGKLKAIVEDIAECSERGQPVLAGTTNVEKSEELSRLLKQRGVKHVVLNAKNHEKEAEIVAQAGRLHAVTIATNMAGRGTDILLGGNPEFLALEKMRKEGVSEELLNLANSHIADVSDEVMELREKFRKFYNEFKAISDEEKEKVIAVGGLRIIGTERHESRRIDNQLRGRAGRQGDIGSSKFYLSFEDHLLRVFGSDRFHNFVKNLKWDEDVPIRMLMTSTVRHAQRHIEGEHYKNRKNVLEFDEVLNKQRQAIYDERSQVLDGLNMRPEIYKMIENRIHAVVDCYTNPKTDYTTWDLESFQIDVSRNLIPNKEFITEELLKNNTIDEIKQKMETEIHSLYENKMKEVDESGLISSEELERVVVLKVIDEYWTNHITDMETLKNAVILKAYAQHEPVVEYKREGYDLYNAMVENFQEEVIRILMAGNIVKAPVREAQYVETSTQGGSLDEIDSKKPRKKKEHTIKIGRNQACPCGSGKKYKNCCGKET